MNITPALLDDIKNTFALCKDAIHHAIKDEDGLDSSEGDFILECIENTLQSLDISVTEPNRHEQIGQHEEYLDALDSHEESVMQEGGQ